MTSRFDRNDFYARLHRNDEWLNAVIAQRRQGHGHVDAYWDQFIRWHVGDRAQRVREAVSISEQLALRELQGKLSGIGLDDIWPVLREICHDAALYIGGGWLIGAVVGGGVGALAFAPGFMVGAVAGSLVGAQAGNWLLGFLGLRSVLGFMAASVPRAVHAYRAGFEEAWGRMPDLNPDSMDAPHYGVHAVPGSVNHAARDFARGHEILVIALLAGVVAYLSKGKGQLPVLLAEVRQSARLGPKMAGWLEQNADRLSKQPLLQQRGVGGGNGAVGAGSAAPGPAVRPRQGTAKEAPAGTAGKVLRDGAQLLGKSEGGPGAWQLSPKRTGGEAYQEQITSVRRGIEYDVACADVPSGKVRFDGYDAERKVLLDAKDWTGYPPKDAEFWHEKVRTQATNQLIAANGVPVEWHFSSPDSLDAVSKVLQRADIDEIRLVLSPAQ